MDYKTIWEGVKFIVPTVLSIASFAFVMKDRRVDLKLRERDGKWFTLRKTDRGVRFEGVVEVYNMSTRANSIVKYEFWSKQTDATYQKLEAEHFTDVLEGEGEIIFNETPLVLAPQSGIGVRVMALTKLLRLPPKITVKIQIEDLHGKHYTTEVTASPHLSV